LIFAAKKRKNCDLGLTCIAVCLAQFAEPLEFIKEVVLFLHRISQKCKICKNSKRIMEIKRDKYLNRLVAHQGN